MKQLRNLKKSLISSAGEDTAYPRAIYNSEVPLSQHCGAVSYVVQKLYGGSLIRGKVNGTTHYWNRLPDGTEVDLTSEQFGGDGFNPVAEGKPVPPRKTINKRFLKFEERVMNEIG